jgi:hypothetical protein
MVARACSGARLGPHAGARARGARVCVGAGVAVTLPAFLPPTPPTPRPAEAAPPPRPSTIAAAPMAGAPPDAAALQADLRALVGDELKV